MRWKRLIRCLGGRRCADLVLTNPDQVPPGGVVKIEYTCASCGTHYVWDSGTGQRQIVDQLTSTEPAFVLGPGESTTITTPVHIKEVQ